MLFYLFQYLDKLDVPGAGVFQYISFRAAMAIITSLAISTIYGKRIIYFLQRKQIGESIRDLGLEGQMQKKGTPTMGGLIILLSIIIPTLLFGDIANIYVILMLVTTLWLGFIGFLDDYIKVFKKNKEGLTGWFKVLGQIGLGLIVGVTLYFSDQVVIREKVQIAQENIVKTQNPVVEKDGKYFELITKKSNLTTIPFLKNNEFDYSWLVWFMGDKAVKYAWIVFEFFIMIHSIK